MIDANEPTGGAVVKQETPTQITTSMILKDLDDGVGREGIKEKYSLETWEVTEMFKNPKLKGKKARKIRKLSFQFIDDTATEDTVDTSEPQFSKREVDEVDPNQTSIPVPTIEDTLEIVKEQQAEEFGDSFDDGDESDEFEY